jgi:hypothetical protein
MITGMHVVPYSRHAEIVREFAKLAERGIQTGGPIADRSGGLATTLALPGGERIGLYELRHPSPLSRRR